MPTLPTDALSPLLTHDEVAAYLGIATQTLRKWRLTGAGPAYLRIGTGARGRVAYRAEDVRAWLAARSFGHTAEETAGAAGPK